MKTSIFLLLVFVLLFLYRVEVATLVLRPSRSIDRSIDRFYKERNKSRVSGRGGGEKLPVRISVQSRPRLCVTGVVNHILMQSEIIVVSY